MPDASLPIPVPDSGGDATTADADAGPTSTETVLSTGVIRVANDTAFATFFADDVVVRWSHAPGCVLLARSPAKEFTTAGTVTIGGAVVGKDGGPAAPVKLDTTNDYFAIDTIFPNSNEFTIDVDHGPPTTGFAALPVQTLQTSLAAPVAVTAPSGDAGTGSLDVGVAQPFVFMWTAPAGDLTSQRLIVELKAQADTAASSKNIELYCGFPLAGGTAEIPVEILADIRKRTGGAETNGFLAIRSGGHRIVTVENATTYVLDVGRLDSTNYPNLGVPVKLK